MRTLATDLAGLAVGFALAGAALAHYLPLLSQYRQPAPVVAAEPPASVAAPALPASAMPAPARPVMLAPPRPAPLPDIATAMPPPEPMPAIVEPDGPDPATAPPRPGSGMAGTGFFVAEGLVMTAAHVVKDCRRTEIISPVIRRTTVSILARDPHDDIALVRAAGVRAPAVLAIGRATADGARVFILGYPASAGLLIPEETWGVLENDKLPRATVTDPRQHIVMEAASVTHGYSGGPIFDPRSGKVVGIVRATLNPSALRAVRGMPATGLTVGPGSALLGAFLENESPGTDAFPADQWGEDPLTVARRATVHVFCWH